MAGVGHAGGMGKLNVAEAESRLAGVPEWRRVGEVISRTFVWRDFAEAMRFVNAVADAAERADHHPDIDIRWNKVTLALSTHSAGGLTGKDFALAQAADQIALGHARG
jgi:4a-hydroxytetrahydrobiopterin dehydratase